MEGDLFKKPAEYTIDSSSLMDIFNDSGGWTSKRINVGLWDKISELITSGVIISHAEAFSEIKKDGTKGEELFDWAQINRGIFKNHNEIEEGSVIRLMTGKYSDFVNRRIDAAYADPWLIAQAKTKGIKIITEEKRSASPDLKKASILNVSDDPLFKVKCLNLLEFARERGWKFGII